MYYEMDIVKASVLPTRPPRPRSTILPMMNEALVGRGLQVWHLGDSSGGIVSQVSCNLASMVSQRNPPRSCFGYSKLLRACRAPWGSK